MTEGDEDEARSNLVLGVTIGTVPVVLEYLTVMVDSLAALRRQFHRIDQGVHNYVVDKGLCRGDGCSEALRVQFSLLVSCRPATR